MHGILSAWRRFAATLSARVAGMMFCLGMSAMLAQIIMTRELIVAYFGNELTLGLIFAFWLLTVSLGSCGIRPFLAKFSAKAMRFMAVGMLVGLAAVLPLLVLAARALRICFNVPPGEYMAFAPMAFSALLVLLPLGLIIGILFPLACRLAAAATGAVARVYTAESAGSMAAGLVFSFGLVYFFTPLESAVLAALCNICGAALIAPPRWLRRIIWLAAVGLAALLVLPAPVRVLEAKAVQLRWEAFGVLSRAGRPAGGQPVLISAADSRYQNLALVENAGQQTLYGNGRVMFVFPDAITAEQKINFIMAQKPAAGKVLLIGGNPVTDIPELLKYPLQSLTHVELDARINKLLRQNAPENFRRALSDPRLRECLMDGPRFVQQSREIFDVVIVEAPEPTTIALNRFYTAEFYRDIRRRLAPDGFFYTAVQSSENLQDAAGNLAASIYFALQRAFPRVLVTAGARNQFFAGDNAAPLTFDRQTLYARSRAAGLNRQYFRPEYFLKADEISPEKVDFVRARLSALRVPANSAFHPISAFYSLSLWSRYSGSGLERVFGALKNLRFGRAGGALAAVWAIMLAVVLLLQMRAPAGTARAGATVVAAVIAATGFAGLALELILIFIFQTLLGYIYASIGLIIAMYMLGLALGSASVKSLAGWERRPAPQAGPLPARQWRLFLALDALLLLVALGLPWLLQQDRVCLPAWPVASVIYLLTLLTGYAGGAQFILAVNLLDRNLDFEIRNSKFVTGTQQAGECPGDGSACGRRTGRNAALLNALDLAGAALGGVSVGIILLPLFGFNGTCGLLAILKAGTFLLISAFLFASRRRR